MFAQYITLPLEYGRKRMRLNAVCSSLKSFFDNVFTLRGVIACSDDVCIVEPPVSTVSLCFEPSHPHRVISGLSGTTMMSQCMCSGTNASYIQLGLESIQH